MIAILILVIPNLAINLMQLERIRKGVPTVTSPTVIIASIIAAVIAQFTFAPTIDAHIFSLLGPGFADFRETLN